VSDFKYHGRGDDTVLTPMSSYSLRPFCSSTSAGETESPRYAVPRWVAARTRESVDINQKSVVVAGEYRRMDADVVTYGTPITAISVIVTFRDTSSMSDKNPRVTRHRLVTAAAAEFRPCTLRTPSLKYTRFRLI